MGSLWTPARFEPTGATLAGNAIALDAIASALTEERGIVEMDYVVYRGGPNRHIVRLTPKGGVPSMAATLAGTPLNYQHHPTVVQQPSSILERPKEVVPRQGAVLTGAAIDDGDGIASRLRMTGDLILSEMADGLIPRTSVEILPRLEAMYCSTCHSQWYDAESKCDHIPGKAYGGERCYLDIDQAEGAGVALTYKPASSGTGPIGMSQDGTFDLSRLGTGLDTTVAIRDSGLDWLFPEWRLERMSETTKPRRRIFRLGRLFQREGQATEVEVEELDAEGGDGMISAPDVSAELAELESLRAEVAALKGEREAAAVDADAANLESFKAEVAGLMAAGVTEKGERLLELVSRDPATLSTPAELRAYTLEVIRCGAERPERGTGLMGGGSVPAEGLSLADEKTKATAIRNRAAELRKANPALSELEAATAARTEINKR